MSDVDFGLEVILSYLKEVSSKKSEPQDHLAHVVQTNNAAVWAVSTGIVRNAMQYLSAYHRLSHIRELIVLLGITASTTKMKKKASDLCYPT